MGAAVPKKLPGRHHANNEFRTRCGQLFGDQNTACGLPMVRGDAAHDALQFDGENSRVKAWPCLTRLGAILRNEPICQITVELAHESRGNGTGSFLWVMQHRRVKSVGHGATFQARK